MAELTLGRFGDRRLEKGGRCCTLGWWNWVEVGYGFAGSERIGRARSD
jgi:hypothetical protein